MAIYVCQLVIAYFWESFQLRQKENGGKNRCGGLKMFRFLYIPNGKPFRSVFEDNECKAAGAGAYLYGLIAKGNEEFSGPYRANFLVKKSSANCWNLLQ